MKSNFWFISGDFLEARKGRIGASDVPALFANPDIGKQHESLAGYGRTPVTVWQEKTGRKGRDPAGLPAEMGHYLEGKAIELFIRQYFGYDMGRDYRRERDRYEFLNAGDPGDYHAANFQNTPFKHHTQVYTDEFIAHADGVFSPEDFQGDPHPVTVDGITVDPGESFGVEAKSARYFAAKRPEGSIIRGYDFDLKTWQGIPLKHYFQIQFSMSLYGLDVFYLPLLYDTSSFHVWRIEKNEKHQGRIIDTAGRMAWHIAHDKAPKELVLNAEDIKALYPDLGEDFRILIGEDRDKAKEVAREYHNAKKQEALWKERGKTAQDSMAVILQDSPEVRDSEGVIAKWTLRKDSERVKGLKEIKGDKNAERYLRRKGFVYTVPGDRLVKIAKVRED